MDDVVVLDGLFREAVSLIDAGDVGALERLMAAHPSLVRDRLVSPGTWLRDQVGDALEGFFRQPYLLWFVAEDPVRNGRLTGNIADAARAIIQAARRAEVDDLQDQLDYALRLVCWSWVARDCGVQIGLVDALLDAGASPDGRALYEGRYGTHAESAIYNGNYAAAEHLLHRGAPLTLTTALCLGRWADADRLAAAAPLGERQDAFVQAALNGNAEALRRMLVLGVDPTTVSVRNQSHGTALHPVWSGRLDAVRVLVEAGADLSRRDTLHDGTPLDWAEYGWRQQQDPSRTDVTTADIRRADDMKQYRDIVAYLRERGGK
jgi:hypothetical protein